MENEVKQEPASTPKAVDLVEAANQARSALEKATEEAREELASLQELKAKEILGGKTEAGQPEEKPKEETPAEYAKRISGRV